jgi:hypothetical protein
MQHRPEMDRLPSAQVIRDGRVELVAHGMEEEQDPQRSGTPTMKATSGGLKGRG